MGAILGAGAIAGLGAVGSSFLGSSAAKKAAAQTAAAMREATAEQRRQYNETTGRLQPFTDFGKGQLNELGNWLNDPTKQPMNYMDPGYRFREEQGMKGLYGNAATSGLLQSGDTLKAAQNYGQGLASTEYGNAFNRWMGEGGFRQNLAGMGQSAAANQGYFGANSANAISDLMRRGGEAEAAGTMGAGKAWGDLSKGVGGLVGNTMAKYIDQKKLDELEPSWQYADPNAGPSGMGGTRNNLNNLNAYVPGGSSIFSPYGATNAAGAPVDF